MSKSAIDRMIGHTPTVRFHDVRPELLEMLRSQTHELRRRLEYVRKLAKPDGSEQALLRMADDELCAAEQKIDALTSDDPALMIWVRAIQHWLLMAHEMLGAAGGIRGGLRARARKARTKGHDESKKGLAIRDARVWWERWQKEPSLYPSKAEFARTMLDKHPELNSTTTIERRCRKWEKGER